MTYLHTRSQNIKKNGGGDKYDLIVLLSIQFFQYITPRERFI